MEKKVVLEVNSRTKEKEYKRLIDCHIENNFTVGDLLIEHRKMQKEIKSLRLINSKLIEAVANLSKSTAVQVADIKEDLK